MDIRQLRYFSEIVEAKSFTKAADRVRIAQPALGLQIKKLEDELASPCCVAIRGASSRPRRVSCSSSMRTPSSSKSNRRNAR